MFHRGEWRAGAGRPLRGDRCGELELDAVRVLEREHVDAERWQPGDLAVGHAALVEQPGRLLQVLAAGDAEAEVVQWSGPARVGG